MQNLRIGQNHPKAVLTDREVERLRHFREVCGWSYNRLAKHFEISKAYVQSLCNYRTR